MTKLLPYLVVLDCFVCVAPAARGQCGYKATISANHNYCVGSSLIAQSTHALQQIVWYRNGQPVSTVTGTQSLNTVPLVISPGTVSIGNANRLCTDGAGNIYVFDGDFITIYRPGATTTQMNLITQGLDEFGDMWVDQPGNIYLTTGDSSMEMNDTTLVMKLAAGTYQPTTLVSKKAVNDPFRYGLPESMFMDCEGNIYIYTWYNQVVKWVPGAATGILVAAPNNGDTACEPANSLGQVWVDNAGAIFFMVGSGIQKLAPGASQATTLTTGGCYGNPSIWFTDFWLDGKDTLYQAGEDIGAKTLLLQKLAPGSATPVTIATIPLKSSPPYDFGSFVMDIKGNFYLAGTGDTGIIELRRSSDIDSIYIPTDTGSYYAVVTDIQGYSTVTDTIVINGTAGSCGDTAMVPVDVEAVPILPNAFTPNGDGRNDRFYVLGGPVNSVVETFDVFNRLGQAVFRAHDVAPGDANAGWDGRLGGSLVAPGTYVYLVVMRFANGSRQMVKGTVEVIR
jgi:gliding motility-associated-like protein